MGGVCYSPSGYWHVWRLTFSTAIRAHILTDDNPRGFLTINDLELAAYIYHLHLFAPHMSPLKHISTGVDNTAAEIWARRGSVSTFTSIGPLLQEAAWITCQAEVHASIKRIPRVKNIEADAASRLTHLPVHAFLKSFNTSFPQPTPWHLSLLPSGVTPRLHTMLLTKQSPKAYPLRDYARTAHHGHSGTPSAHGCRFQTTSKTSKKRSPSYRSSITRSAQASWQRTTSPSTSEAWSNTSALWDRYLRPWGPLTQDSTVWAPSTLPWDDSL